MGRKPFPIQFCSVFPPDFNLLAISLILLSNIHKSGGNLSLYQFNVNIPFECYSHGKIPLLPALEHLEHAMDKAVELAVTPCIYNGTHCSNPPHGKSPVQVDP